MKIIEFVGVPGAGKSTICELLEKKLSNQGFRVLNLHVFELNENFYKKVKRKYTEKRAKYSKINKQFRMCVDLLELTNEIDVYEWVQNIEVMNYRIAKEAPKYDYILFDEGIIQAITALYHGQLINDNEAISNLMKSFCEKYLRSTLVVDLDINLDLVCERIKKRNRDGDQFLNSSEDKMKTILTEKKRNIQFVLEMSDFPIEHLNAETSIEKLLDKVFNVVVS